jgi:prepilin-type N-terminal cleavage/methylation domain-containing protein
VVVMTIRTAIHRVPRDEGYTLVELLVASSIFVICIGMAFTALQAITQAQDMATREATLTRNITYPINQFEKYSMQNNAVAVGEAYRFDFWIDVHNNNTPDKVSFWADSAGGFWKSTQQFDAATKTVPIGSAKTFRFSTDNCNVSSAKPVFVYYAKNGAALATPLSAADVPRADAVKITLVSKYKTQIMESFTTVTFRNRNY